MDVKPWGMFSPRVFDVTSLLRDRAGSIFTDSHISTDDETDLAALEASVRSIEKDGLVWGASKFVAVGFGIKKLQINLVVEDDKVSLEELEEEIVGFEDYVQSSDVVAMQKL